MNTSITLIIDPSKNNINYASLPMTEFDVLLMAIRNSEDGFTHLPHPTMSIEYKAKLVIFRDGAKDMFIWDAENMGFVSGAEPSWWIKLQLKICLLLGI